MKLYHAKASPFVRKVVALIKETGLEDQVDFAPASVTPLDPFEAMLGDNPLGKLPTLVTDDGEAIFDSRLICEYLDCQHSGPRMIPAEGAARWRIQRIHAMCDGILDAAVLCRYETFLRPEEKRWSGWIDGQMGKIARGLKQLNDDLADLGDTVNMATIAAACVYGYLDFRFPDYDWRAEHADAAAWYAGFSQRPSMAETAPE